MALINLPFVICVTQIPARGNPFELMVQVKGHILKNTMRDKHATLKYYGKREWITLSLLKSTTRKKCGLTEGRDQTKVVSTEWLHRASSAQPLMLSHAERQCNVLAPFFVAIE